MTRWIIEEPRELSFDGPDGLDTVKVSLVGGHVAVLATDGTPRLEISDIREPPVVVDYVGGRLTVSYADWPWEGLLRWVNCGRRAATVTLAVPGDCRVNLGVVSASTVVSGIQAATSIRTVSGDVTLDGLTEKVDVQTVSGDVEAHALGGVTSVNSVSGPVTVSSGRCEQLRSKTVSGKVIADLDLVGGATVTVGSVSGDITVRIPQAAAAAVELRSVSGRIGSAFADLRRAPQPGSRAMHGTLGDGSGSLAASTVSGDIALLRREPMATEGAA